MRLAHFIQRYPPALGGSEAYFARLSRFHVQAGDQVVVFTTTGDELESFWNPRARQFPPGTESLEGVEVRRYPLFHLPFLHRYLLKAASLIPLPRWQALTVPFNPLAPRMWQAVTAPQQPFDAVHACAFPYSFPLVCAARLARRCNIPLFLTPFVHTGDPDNPQDPIRRAYTTPALLHLARSAARLFVQTEGERDTLLALGIPPERVVLQGLGVDLSSCTGGDRDRARRRWQLDPNAVVVGHLANNSVEKGSVDLLLAAEVAWRRGARFTLLLAGAEMPNFRAFWNLHRPSGPVLRLGVLSSEEKRDFFAALDLFALPSRSDSFGLVLPEAWANGVPCIGYRAGGIAWVIRDTIDGRLVHCGDLEALGSVLAELSDDAPQRQRLGTAGRARLPEFDWSTRLELVRRIIDEECALHK